MIVGPHLSIARGLHEAIRVAASIQADTFQFFTRNPRGGKARALDYEDIARGRTLMKQEGIGPLVAHAPYTLNLASDKAGVRDFARLMMMDDLFRLSQMPCGIYNIHPGSHVGAGVDEGIKRITGALNEILSGKEGIVILLETMAGQGTEIGGSFEEIQRIIEGVRHAHLLGVCLDTCHVFSAGYDLVGDLDGVIDTFDRVIGLDRLRVIHLNDSKMPFDSGRDRHEKIGKGTLGLEVFKKIVTHPKLKDLPFILETPNEVAGYGEEIQLIRSFAK
ncbi:MAG: endonuclease IV [delta proteobacterium ML8_F1]|nr:MAG: endonuclease IV [delta proteobacterium ML8_F1]